MRMGFGLLALLIGVGLYLYLSASSAQKTAEVTRKPREMAEQVAGHGMGESFSADPVEANGKVTGFAVKTLEAEGPMAKMYDLKVGDVIVGVGPFSFKDTDAAMLKAQILELGSHPQDLTVMRAGEKLTLTNHGAAKQMNGLSIPSH